jgi:hypothetical protein
MQDVCNHHSIDRRKGETRMNFLRNLFGKKQLATTSSSTETSQPTVAPSIEKKQSVTNQPKKTIVAGDNDAEWADKPLHCPKCRTKLHDKTPRFGMIRGCKNCGTSFTIRNYNIE